MYREAYMYGCVDTCDELDSARKETRVAQEYAQKARAEKTSLEVCMYACMCTYM